MDIFQKGWSMDFVLKSNYLLCVFETEIIAKKFFFLIFCIEKNDF